MNLFPFFIACSRPVSDRVFLFCVLFLAFASHALPYMFCTLPFRISSHFANCFRVSLLVLLRLITSCCVLGGVSCITSSVFGGSDCRRRGVLSLSFFVGAMVLFAHDNCFLIFCFPLLRNSMCLIMFRMSFGFSVRPHMLHVQFCFDHCMPGFLVGMSYFLSEPLIVPFCSISFVSLVRLLSSRKMFPS